MTKKYRYHLWVGKEDMAALEHVAKVAGCSRPEWIRRVLSEAIRDASVSLLATKQWVADYEAEEKRKCAN
jgi:hypothetical protein